MSIYKNGKLVAGGSQALPLLCFMWSDHQLNHPSWLNSTTFSWQSGAVYQAAYQHLADDIDGKTLQSETVAGTTIQFYLADDGHKICPASEESNVSAIYNATGVAWYYIIDTANTRFKLPRTQFAFTGIRNGVGGFVEAGLPNITGSFDAGTFQGNTNGTGAFTGATAPYNWALRGTYTAGYGANYPFNASNSNSIYGNSDTVQPKATEMYLYFYVGNFTQTALENTAGITTEEMNNKVNIGHEVIEFQEPTAGNNYTWYRKYADGWVEQGGITATTTNTTVSLSVEMADTNYSILATSYKADAGSSNASNNGLTVGQRTTTTFYIVLQEQRAYFWQVSGMAA